MPVQHCKACLYNIVLHRTTLYYTVVTSTLFMASFTGLGISAPMSYIESRAGAAHPEQGWEL
eukprot:6090316-Pyramimonas_sp.AAC.1